MFDRYSEVFRALSHPIRLKIVCGLIEKDNCNVKSMSEKLKVSQPLVSQHLSVLRNAMVIVGYRKGNEICYRVEDNRVKEIIRILAIEVEI